MSVNPKAFAPFKGNCPSCGTKIDNKSCCPGCKARHRKDGSWLYKATKEPQPEQQKQVSKVTKKPQKATIKKEIKKNVKKPLKKATRTDEKATIEKATKKSHSEQEKATKKSGSGWGFWFGE